MQQWNIEYRGLFPALKVHVFNVCFPHVACHSWSRVFILCYKQRGETEWYPQSIKRQKGSIKTCQPLRSVLMLKSIPTCIFSSTQVPGSQEAASSPITGRRWPYELSSFCPIYQETFFYPDLNKVRGPQVHLLVWVSAELYVPLKISWSSRSVASPYPYPLIHRAGLILHLIKHTLQI